MKNYSNIVTVLTSTQAQHKTWKLNENNEYEIIDKTFSKWYLFEEVAIKDIYDMHDLLIKKSFNKNSCLVRGNITEHAYEEKLKGYKITRTLREKVEGNKVIKPTIEDYPKKWIMLDIDNYLVPEGLNMGSKFQREKAVEMFIQTLHESFHNSSYVCQFSNGMTPSSKKLKSHIWFMLKESWDCETLKPWFTENYPQIDKCIFRPAQILYTANPSFVDCQDPLENQRIYLKEKASKEVLLPKKEITTSYIMYKESEKDNHENIN
jgi:hypothetical protein